MQLGGPRIDVEDVVQEVFLLAHSRLGSFAAPRWQSDGGSVTTWLYRTTANLVRRKRVREHWRRRLWALWAPAEVDSGEGPVEGLERMQDVARVYTVLDRLPERDRRLLVLFEMEGLPGEEIARLMGARTATVWVWLHRARERFLRELAAIDQVAPVKETR